MTAYAPLLDSYSYFMWHQLSHYGAYICVRRTVAFEDVPEDLGYTKYVGGMPGCCVLVAEPRGDAYITS